MSRDEMLEEAIAKAKERKEWQLVEWLRSARGATASARYYTECIADLNAENAKLRQLVRDMWRGCPVDERDCIACDFERDGMCDLFDRMRELGVDA